MPRHKAYDESSSSSAAELKSLFVSFLPKPLVGAADEAVAAARVVIVIIRTF